MNNTQQKQYIRTERTVPPETRQKIANSLRGRCKSFAHRNHIAQGVKDYWLQIPSAKSGTTTMNDLI